MANPPDALVQFVLPDRFSLLETWRALRRSGVNRIVFGHAKDGTSLVFLLRAVSPPFSITLPASERHQAFVEHAPRLLLEHGSRSRPIARAPRREDRQVLCLADGTIRRLTSIILYPGHDRKPFPLPEWPARLAEQPGEIPVRVRLIPARSLELPSFWVVHGDAWGILNEFVATADERATDNLDVAVSGDGRALVLRAMRARTAPTLSANLTPYSPLMRLPHVFVPHGMRLLPSLRRDTVRDWLCRPDQVVWLRSGPDGSCQIESMPLESFHVLTSWIDYFVNRQRARTPRLMEAPFRLEHFDVKADLIVSGPRPKRERERDDEPAPVGELPTVVKGVAPPRPLEPMPPPVEEVEAMVPSVALIALHDEERYFLDVAGPLDAPERIERWPRLGDLAHAAGFDEDASLAYANAIWFGSTRTIEARWQRVDRLDDVTSVLRAKNPSIAQLRGVAAYLVHASATPALVKSARKHLSAATTMLEENDFRLPTRMAWLSWLAISRIAGGDVLALTRARDRILADLHENGLRADRDLPGFLRTGAPRDLESSPVDVHRLVRLNEQARNWCRGRSAGWSEASTSDPILKVFVDLVFAFAMARCGDVDGARNLLVDIGLPSDSKSRTRSHRPAPHTLQPYQRWLWSAYRERVERSLQGEPATSPLSPELRRDLIDLDAHGMAGQRQHAERFLSVSRILEPFSRVDPYRQMRQTDDQGRELSELAAFTVPRRRREKATTVLESGFRSLFDRFPSPSQMLRTLLVAVPMSVRVGESFAIECLEKLLPLLAKIGRWMDVRDLVDRIGVAEAGLGIAAHFGRMKMIDGLVNAMYELVRQVKGEIAAWMVAGSNGQTTRQLSRLGLGEVARQWHQRLVAAVTEGADVEKLLDRPGLNRGVFLPALLRLANGWYYFEQPEPANEVIAAARQDLFGPGLSPEPRTRLAEAYCTALGHAPEPQAMSAYAELFERLPVATPSFEIELYHRLSVIEPVALASSSESFSSGPQSRRWLDEDEFLVRSRIHADLAEAMRTAGL